MSKVHIVTDSGAHFVNAHFVQQNPVTVVPNRITIGDAVYREGEDLSAEEALQLIARHRPAPTVTPPTVGDYMQAYERLAPTHDTIISIHASREIFESWHNARSAAHNMMGYCDIIVLDSQTLCAAQGLLVQVAVRAIQDGQPPDEVVRIVRGAVDRLYAIYYVETLDFLLHSRIMSASHTVLGTMLGIRPFVSLEEGHLVAIEKVRTRGQAVERLVEFAVEFTDIEQAVILQSRLAVTDQTRSLQERLGAEFPQQQFPYTVYAPSLAALIGTDATGIVILESEISTMEFFEDDF
jgi:DegV family protein with EDD domain